MPSARTKKAHKSISKKKHMVSHRTIKSLKRPKSFSKLQLIAIAVIFAAVGGVAIYLSFAAGSLSKTWDTQTDFQNGVLSSTTATSDGHVTLTPSTSSSTMYEDTATGGWPKKAYYLPFWGDLGTSYNYAHLGQGVQWLVQRGWDQETPVLDRLYSADPSILTMIIPSVNFSDPATGLAWNYGAFDQVPAFNDTNTPAGGRTIGQVRAFTQSDWFPLANGSGPTNFNGLKEVNYLSNDSAVWSADARAHYAKQAGLYTDPALKGVWGDDDFWSTETYGYPNSALVTGSQASIDAAKHTFDDNFIAAHVRMSQDLPGMVIGGNGLSTMATITPNLYKGSSTGGVPDWSKVGDAGMLECAEQFYNGNKAVGMDTIISGTQRFLALEALDGHQRYQMINHCTADTDAKAAYGLALSTIAGGYLWPYKPDLANPSDDPGWGTSPNLTVPGFNGPTSGSGTTSGKGWLGQPTSPPYQIQSGAWARDFQNGTVFVNANDNNAVTAFGQTIQPGNGIFLGTVVQLPNNTSGSSSSGTTYPTQGTITLSYDAGTAVDWNSLSQQPASNPANTNITYMVQTSSNNSTWSSPTTIAAAANSQYIRVIATLTTTDTSVTPSLDSLTLTFDPINSLPAPTITQNITTNQVLSGTVNWTATVTSGASSISSVEFAMDNNTNNTTDTTSPYSRTLNTTTLTNGTHTMGLTVTLTDGSVVWQPYQIGNVTVNNPSVPPIPGDINGDTHVTITDLSILLANYSRTSATAQMGDINGDTVVNITDLSILLSNYGQ